MLDHHAGAVEEDVDLLIFLEYVNNYFFDLFSVRHVEGYARRVDTACA
jgi:hypothetical protein